MFQQTRRLSQCSRHVCFLLSLTMSSVFVVGMSQGAKAQGTSAAKDLVANGPIPGQPSKQSTEVKNPATTANEISKSSAGNSNDATMDEQLNSLRKQLADQQRQIDELRRLLQARELPNGRQAEMTATNSAAPTTVDPKPGYSSTAPSTSANIGQAPAAQPAPLSFRIGSAYITPVGFMDFTAVFRSTNTGNNIGTNFNAIPFSNTAQGNLSEIRLSMQNSRIGFRVDAKVHGARVIGYMESDFLGNNPNNTFVSSNSNTLRSRLYWVDVRKNKFEFLGGQSWSMMTPGRTGISPIPADLFYTQNVDVNYQVGLTWARQAQFRMVYHPNDNVAIGLSIENPEQFVGNPISITFPKGLATVLGPQFDAGGSNATPNLHPDIIGKVALDKKLGDRAFHIEGVAFMRGFKDTFPNAGSFAHSTKEGGGGAVNFNLEVIKNVRLISNNFFSAGGGRYVFGQAPDIIVKPDGSISLIKTFSTVQGIEATVKTNTLLYAYYGGVVSKRNFVVDTTDPLLAKIGYGFPGAPTTQNRAIQEGTFGLTQTFWRDAKYGALQFMAQYSYLTRSPWSVAAGTPTKAKSNMLFLNLRYSLPGSAPKKVD